MLRISWLWCMSHFHINDFIWFPNLFFLFSFFGFFFFLFCVRSDQMGLQKMELFQFCLESQLLYLWLARIWAVVIYISDEMITWQLLISIHCNDSNINFTRFTFSSRKKRERGREIEKNSYISTNFQCINVQITIMPTSNHQRPNIKYPWLMESGNRGISNLLQQHQYQNPKRE